jgi:hypothetical protein
MRGGARQGVRVTGTTDEVRAVMRILSDVNFLNSRTIYRFVKGTRDCGTCACHQIVACHQFVCV